MQTERYCISWACIQNCPNVHSAEENAKYHAVTGNTLKAEVESIKKNGSVVSLQARTLTKLYNLTNGWTRS